MSRGARRRARKTKKSILVGSVATAIVASLLAAVVSAKVDDYDVAGKSIEMAMQSMEPMKRPNASDGVELKAPKDAETDDGQRDYLPVDPDADCEKSDRSSEDIGIKEGTELCAKGASRQSAAAAKAPRFELVDDAKRTEIPDEPTDVDPPEDSTEPEGSGEPGDDSDGLEPTPSDSPPVEPSPTPSPGTGTPDTFEDDDANAEGAAFRYRPNSELTDTFIPTVTASGSSSFLSPNWALNSGPTAPTARSQVAMGFDPVRKQVVLFGGLKADGNPSQETWLWSQGVWSMVTPTTKPPFRAGASMTWDPTVGGMVLFGGVDGTTYRNDVWKWDGTNWTQLTPTGTAPVARTQASMAYDPARGGIVIFGGFSSSTALRNDTFQLKNNAWTQIQANAASGAPTARAGASLAYSQSTSQLVLFGGQSSTSSTAARLSDTKILGATATSWTAKSPTHVPTGRNLAAMTFDPGIDGLVMFGGISANGTTTTLRNDTWAWNGSDWLQATGIASPPGRSGAGVAATDAGEVVLFGGVTTGGASNQTWLYDAGLPLLSIAVSHQDPNVSATAPFYEGDSAKIRVTAVNAGAQAITSSSKTSISSPLPEAALAAGTEFLWGGNSVADCSSGATLCGQVSGLIASIANIDIPAAGTRTLDLVATVAGTHRGCKIIDIPALASSLFGKTAEIKTPLTVCGGGLGTEDWWTYDTTDLGGGGTASVNVANGNLVVKQSDSTPVQTRGQLALALGRTYNSQDLMSGGGPLGVGWQWDIGETGETAGGFGIAGLKLPNLQTLTQPLSMPYIDRDGTRHVFKLRSVGVSAGSISLPIDLSNGLASVKNLLNPQTLPFKLNPDSEDNLGYLKVCIDQAYTGPPGTDMYLFRYLGVGNNGCTNQAPPGPGAIQLGWSLVRPDRVRYDFNALGDLVRVTDPAGRQLIYTPGVLYGPTEVSQTCDDGDMCRKITIDYNAGGTGPGLRHVKVTDSAGRVTSYVVTTDPLTPLLKQVWEPGNPLSTDATATPSASYTYADGTQAGRCVGSTSSATSIGQLCSVVDANGGKTTFTYTAAPVGPARVLRVTDRRGNDAADSSYYTKGLATRYTYNDANNYVTADMAPPSTILSCDGNPSCQRIRYSGIDDAGRVAQIAEGTANDSYLRQTAYFWDGTEQFPSCAQPQPVADNNLCQTIRRAVPSSTAFTPGTAGTATLNGVTVSDEATDFTYGNLGQLLRKKVLLDASQPWTNANSAITTWGTYDQYFDANGDQRGYSNHVTGNGNIASSGADDNYPGAVQGDNPIGYWRLGETSGSVMKSDHGGPSGQNDGIYYPDVVSGTYRGQAGAIPTNPALREKKTIGEPAASARVDTLANAPSGTTATGSDFSAEVWVKSSGSEFETAFRWGPSAEKYAAVGRLNGGYPFVYLSSDTASTKWLIRYSQTPVTDGKWHHVVYSYDGSGSASGVDIWVDQVKQSNLVTYSDTLDGEYTGTNPSAVLGDATNDTSYLDEVALYDHKLTQTQISDHYNRANGGKRLQTDTLYAVTDQVQKLSPRGNASTNWGDYLTRYDRDVPAPGTIASTNKPAGSSICGSAPTGNTGRLCGTYVPASNAVAAGACTDSPISNMPVGSPSAPTSGTYKWTCTKYEYNVYGQRTVMRTPKANAEQSSKAIRYIYYDNASSCAGSNAANCDLSGTVSAAGWLKAVTDPTSPDSVDDAEKIVFAYDSSGNVSRTWDRNAAHGKPLNATWTSASAPPTAKFTETVSSTPVTSDALSVSSSGLVTVAPDGTVQGTGTNGSGQLGDGSQDARTTPTRALGGLSNVVEVDQSAGVCASTVYRTGAGEVWYAGQLNGTLALKPTKVPGLKDIISVAAGGCHFLALDARGGLWTWGANDEGQLGANFPNSTSVPTKILDDVATIAAGTAHSLAVKTNGRLLVWGANASGQLGLGDTSRRTSPTEVNDVSGLRAVSAGSEASYGLRRNGTLYSWGANASGELGLGDTTQRTTPTALTAVGPNTAAGTVRQVVGGANTTAALMSDGRVRAWGRNDSGQLGTSGGNATSPVLVPDLTNQVAISGGSSTWATADKGGKITVWGATGANQLANGTAPTSSTPTTAGIDISPFRLPWRYTRASRDATAHLQTNAVDRLGNVRSTRSGRGNATFTSAYDSASGYDATQREIWSITPANREGAKVATTDYSFAGNAVKTVDARGNARLAAFDAVNRKVSESFTRPTDTASISCSTTATTAEWSAGQNGQKVCTTSVTYDGLDQTITTTDAMSQVARAWYDSAGRRTRTDQPRNDSKITTLTSRWLYDLDGNVTTSCSPRQFDSASGYETNTTASCTTSGQFSTNYTIDRAGRTSIETTTRAGSPNLTITRTYGFDADGNTTRSTNENSNSTTATFDLLGRRLTETRPRASGVYNTTRWDYDFSGNVTAVRAPGSLNTGSGVDGNLVVDGTTASNSTDGNTHSASNPFKIPDGAQYRNVTLQNGGRVTSTAANGLMFYATGIVTICNSCSVDMSGKGYKGGVSGANADNPNTGSTPGNGGTAGAPNALLNGAGGGGGGHRTAGSNGLGGTTAAGGLKSGNEDFTGVGTTYLRGSGGGGGGGGQGLLAPATNGGDGGGYVRITASKMIVEGTIDASGKPGGSGPSNAGGGGGGAGGGIWIAAPTIDLAANALTVAGGVGGTTTSDRKGGDGANGRIRIDADTVTNAPSDADRSRAARITAYSYDAANRVLDTVEGAQTGQADPALDDGEFAVPDPNGLSNTRTRNLYDADGQIALQYPSQAFSDSASLTDPKVNTAKRYDRDLDGRVSAIYSPRFDSSVTSLGSGDDGAGGSNQQTAQCTTNRVVDAVDGAKPYTSSAGVCVMRIAYDPNGNIQRQVLPTSNGSDNRYVDYTYLPENVVRTVDSPDPNGPGRVTSSTMYYDAAGRPTGERDANNQFKYINAYSSDGLLLQTLKQNYTDGDNNSITVNESYRFDANGNLKTRTTGTGNVTTNTWTTDNLLQRTKAPGQDASTFNTTTYTYDRAGNPTAVLSPQQESSGLAVINEFTPDNLLSATHTPISSSSFRSVRYAYSMAGLKVATETAKCDSGTVSNCTPSNAAWNSAGTIRLTYGANGRVADEIGRDRKSISTSYDSTGSPKKVVDPVSGVTTNATYYLDGNLRTVDDGRNENTYAYNGLGQPTMRSDKTGAAGVTGGSTSTTSYAYNDAGQASTMQSDVLAATTTYEWDDVGRMTKEQTGGHYNEMSWNPDGSLAGTKTTAGGSTKAEFKYRYDKNGDITKQIATGAETYTNSYTYTPGRNVRTWNDGTDTIRYDWDRNNNRTGAVITSGSSDLTVGQWTYRADNSLSTSTRRTGTTNSSYSYTYNDAGLQTSDDCQSTTYDDFDRVEKVVYTKSGVKCDLSGRTTEYTYDGLDRQRTIKVSGDSDTSANTTTSSIYDGLSTSLTGQTNAITSDNSKPNTLYQLDSTNRAMAIKQTGSAPTKAYLDTDGQGNTSTVVNVSDTVSCAAKVDPFGGPLQVPTSAPRGSCKSGTDKDTVANAVWYRGQVRDASTGDYQLGARTYDPATGSFTAPDTFRVASPAQDVSVGTDPLTANTYSYVNGNPINLSDPTGHSPFDDIGGALKKAGQKIKSGFNKFQEEGGNFINGIVLGTAGDFADLLARAVPTGIDFRFDPWSVSPFADIDFDFRPEVKQKLYDLYDVEADSKFTKAGEIASLAVGAVGLAKGLAVKGVEFGVARFASKEGEKVGAGVARKVDEGVPAVTRSGEKGGTPAERPSTTKSVSTKEATEVTNRRAAEGAGDGAETYYRTMSKEHFAELQSTGRVPATSETFISPSAEFASAYDGQMVEFSVRPGTRNSLADVGVRDGSAATKAAFPNMPGVASGWTSSSALFKRERGIINIGLGRGTALDIFNDAILEFRRVG